VLESNNVTVLPTADASGTPLTPWTYTNPELLDLEIDALFLRRWQFIGHVTDVPNAGDFITGDIGRNSVVAIRDKDDSLRAFLNVCRHRASRVFEGHGSCRGVIKCRYHGWTYRFDGSLLGIPQEENFPGVDRSKLGLHPVQLEVFYGLIFVRVKGDGPSVSEQFAHTAHYFEKYAVDTYERFSETTTQIWDANWKVAWDNYMENYHIPVGHPGLNRLLRENDEWEELSSGVGYGVFEIREKLSKVPEERQYQEQFHHGNKRLPEELNNRWVQFGFAPNLGIDLYPEMLDTFKLVPLGPEKTAIVSSFYGHPNATPEEQELRRLNMLINDPVNEEDRLLCTRVQQGLHTSGYRPGPLSLQEDGINNFHDLVRELVPVTALPDAPPRGSVTTENLKLAELK
jgi:phenylpropionate dioxygenase-like ring-hydroxylating dioxygenase large terminal subunit